MADACCARSKKARARVPRSPRLRVRAKGGILSRSKIESTIDLSQTIARSSIISPIVMREFQHRVANTLAVLSSSLRLELATFSTPGLEEALRRHEKRVIAVADLHRFFGRYSEVLEFSAEHYFQSLCALLSKSILSPLGLHCEVLVDKAPMRAEKCELLGLAITELVLNAAKHAFPGKSSGRVRIEVVMRDDRWYCTVSDNGIGIWKMSSGSGSQITDGLVDALEGQLTVCTGRNGTAVSITFTGKEGYRWS
jgi:two-component sensor histidine kinase